MTEISFASLRNRILFLTGLLVMLIASGWFITRTAIGDRLAIVATETNDYDMFTKLVSMDAAVQFAPRVASLHYQRGQAYFSFASGEGTETRLKEAISAFRTAAGLSPENYRIWLALGQALERAGQIQEAKKAFAQAHWALANHLLRNNETEAAFAEFKRALAIRPTELPLLFDYAWNMFNGDVPTIIRALDPSIYAKAQFAGLLMERGKVTEGIAMWRDLNSSAPALARSNARAFIHSLLAKQQFGMAYEIWQAAAQVKRADEAALTAEARQEEANWYTVHKADTGSFLSNGDFESDLRTGTVAPFLIWRLTPTKGLIISRNNQKHKSGSFSLQLSFDMGGNVGFPIIEQLLPIKPSTNYRLSFAAQTENLQTLSAPLIEVYDPADINRLRATTKPLPLGTNAWQEYTIDFTTAAATEAVMVRVLRPACGDPICPILGRVWLDNFKLEQK
jgi:tetratricopeptide (TPR) repeat protein